MLRVEIFVRSQQQKKMLYSKMLYELHHDHAIIVILIVVTFIAFVHAVCHSHDFIPRVIE